MLRQSVDAFLITPAARELVAVAFKDRRLLRLDLRLHDGDIPAAAAAYAGRPSPPLILIETALADGLPEALDQLAEVCEPGTNLILLGVHNDIDLYRQLIRRGIADYLVLPSEPARLAGAVMEVFADPAKAPKGRVVAFLSAKGGCGSSTLAHTTAHLLADLTGTEVLLVDLDLSFGSADLSFNVENVTGVQNLLIAPDRIDEVLIQRYATKFGERLSLLTAPASLDADLRVTTENVERTIQELRRLVRYVVLDLPHVWAEWLRAALRDADDVVVVALPDLASMRNARNAIDFLHGFRPLDEPPILVLNREGGNPKGDIRRADFAASVGLPPAVVIPNDPEGFGLAASYGKLLPDVKPRSKAIAPLRALAEKLGRADLVSKGVRPVRRGGLKAWLSRPVLKK